MSKPTVATLKSFIRKNKQDLFIHTKSHFDGMYDSVMNISGSKFEPVRCAGAGMTDRTLGIAGAWVTHGRNHITEYNNGEYRGYAVWNCCGEFILAIPV